MRFIPLTQGKSAWLDDEDFERINTHKWGAQKTKEGDYYAIRTICHKDGRHERMYMHREIMGAGADQEVDHRNGNKLDNRKANLRIATAGQNQWNKGKNSNNSTGYKGVFYDPSPNHNGRPFYARLKRNNKRMRLGYFSTPEEAAKAYDKAALQNDGEFVYLNFPDLIDQYRKELGLDEAA